MTAAPSESPELPEAFTRKRTRPLDSLTAASTRLTDQNLERFAKVHKATTDNWQTETREMYHLIGELRFLANMIANRVGQARLHVAKLSEDPTADPDPINTEIEDLPEGVEPPSEDDLKAVAAFQSVGESPIQRGQMITRAAVNLFTTGDGWFVGTPPAVEAELNPRPEVPGTLVQAPVAPTTDDSPAELDLTTLTWRYLSVAEVSFDKTSHNVKLQIGDSEKGTWEGNPDQVLMFRCWRPDPFEWWTADSPTRSSLPVLRELVGLTMAVSAQVDSRLAGAGVFLVPQSAKDAVLAAMGPPQEGQEDEDPFVDAIMEAMLTPISDRSNASALVPLILTVPDDTIEKFRHLKFSSDLDAQYQTLREEALSRFALGADAPPEALTGVGGMNHWGAWIVKEDTVTTHVEPPTAVICDAWTTQFLWPVLEADGMAPETARQYVVWYSVEHLIVRPNRFQDAVVAYDHEELSGPALRRYGGFTDDDAPEGGPDEAFAMVLQLIHRAPALAVTPGIPALVEQIRAVLASTEPTPGTQEQADAAGSPDGVPPDPTAGESLPGTADAPAALPASGALAVREPYRPRELVTSTHRGNGDQSPQINVTVNLPDGAVQTTVEPTPITFAPQVHVPSSTPPDVNVQVHPTPVLVDNQIHVDPTPVTVRNQVDVAAAPAPEVTVTVDPTPVTVESPVTVNLPETPVTVELQPVPRKVIRDGKGQITGVE